MNTLNIGTQLPFPAQPGGGEGDLAFMAEISPGSSSPSPAGERDPIAYVSGVDFILLGVLRRWLRLKAMRDVKRLRYMRVPL